MREPHAAGGGANEQGGGFQQRRFAGAVGADKRNAFTGRDGKRNAAESKSSAVALGEVYKFQAQSGGRLSSGISLHGDG